MWGAGSAVAACGAPPAPHGGLGAAAGAACAGRSLVGGCGGQCKASADCEVVHKGRTESAAGHVKSWSYGEN